MIIKTDNRDLLTPREREIVTLVAQSYRNVAQGYRNVAEGYRNKEIAQKLLISEQTVKNHLHHIFAKLGVAHRRDLALFDVHKTAGQGNVPRDPGVQGWRQELAARVARQV